MVWASIIIKLMVGLEFPTYSPFNLFKMFCASSSSGTSHSAPDCFLKIVFLLSLLQTAYSYTSSLKLRIA